MAILKQISEKNGQVFKTNVVINNADIRSQGSLTQLKEFITKNNTYIDLYKTVIYSRADFKKAYGEGLGVVEMDANSKAALELMNLVKEIQKDF
jgi:chromosome partitioning protein